MATVLIIALAAVWLLVVLRWRDSSRGTASAVEEQRRALAAMRTASETARAGRRPAVARAATPPPRRPWARTQLPALAAGLAATVALVIAIPLAWQALGRGSGPGGRPVTSAASRPRPTATSTTTSTTATPPPPVVSLAETADGEARYAVDHDGYRVTVIAHAPCWLQARATGGGTVVFEGTLRAGETQTFPAAHTLWLRLGAPGSVAVTVDDRPLALTGAPEVPVNLAFAGPAPAA